MAMLYFIFATLFLIISMLILAYKFSRGLSATKLLVYLHFPLVLVNFIFFIILAVNNFNKTTLFYPGIFVFLTGAAVFSLGAVELKERAIIPKKKLVTGGIYAYMKHPIYNGIVISALGISLISGSWLVLIYSFAIIIMLFINSRVEERELARRFGKEYEEYKKSL